MHRVYKILFLVVVAFTSKTIAAAQSDSTKHTLADTASHVASDTSSHIISDTVPSGSVNVDLENIFNSKMPKDYIISDIKVTGTKSFDPNLIISISGLAVNDKVTIPGGDNFSKAIANLWKQNLVSDVQVYFTNLVGNKLSIEINITDRPSLTAFKFKGISKGEADDLSKKLGLEKGRTTRVTENLKRSSIGNYKEILR